MTSRDSRPSLFIDQFDFCTGESLLSAEGSAPLADPDFQVLGRLDSATLTTTIEVCDFVSGACFPVDIDLTWTGTGEIERNKDSLHFDTPCCKFRQRFMGTRRVAEASGSISDGVTNFIPEPAVFAQLVTAENARVTIGCE